MPITLITLLKRRDGMSREEFRRYYETSHRRIGEQVLGGYASRYVRRYLTPIEGDEQPFDVVMEIDFPDETTMHACFAAMSDPEIADMIAKDEAMLFDRSQIRTFTVSEVESSMPEPD